MDGKKLEAAGILKHAGMSWNAIERIVGVNTETLRKELEPGYRERRNARTQAQRRLVGYSTAESRHHVDRAVTPHEADRALATIPTDTRNFTARAMGDPLPGRSALDKKLASPVAKKIDVDDVFRTIEMEDRHSNFEAVD